MDFSEIAIAVCKDIFSQLDDKNTIFESYYDKSLFKQGGSVEFLEGNIFDLNDCPGPYDIIIERRTIQGFLEPQDRDKAVKCLVKRLAKKGILFSHYHDSRGDPFNDNNSDLINNAKPIFLKYGLEEIKLEGLTSLQGQAVTFFISSG
jgi:hypothetical protein